jgi:hypothetical protein
MQSMKAISVLVMERSDKGEGKLTCERVQRSDGQFHVDKHEILTEAIESDAGVDRGEERHW